VNAKGGGLAERARQVLRGKAMSTLELARTVLSLEGNPSAAAAAVFALLGADRRFRVDGQGNWTLAPGADGEGALRGLTFAVVDVETTGGGPDSGNRVTEVAIVEVRDGGVGESFQSLVNPGRPIPPRIQGLTGITDEMVRSAPSFEGVAPEVWDRLSGKIFVAHNAAFDWGFLDRELLEALGRGLEAPRLCTVRLGRSLVPGLASYSLDPLAQHFSIPIHSRHRAFGDALATARLLIHLLDRAEALGVSDLGGLHGLMAAASRATPRSRSRSRPSAPNERSDG